MNIEDYNYNLPENLIAKFPANKRTESNLLCLNRKTSEILHNKFFNILDFLQPNDLLVVNNTKVIPARLFGNKESGGKIEVFIERILEEKKALVHIKSSRAPRPETNIFIDNVKLKVIGRDDSEKLFILEVLDEKIDFYTLMSKSGEIPLPPYFKRSPDEEDNNRYQTVYANKEGSVAAPTAGLHFDDNLLNKIKAKGVEVATLMLHVGSGTFQPVKVDNVKEHKMHSEYMEINKEICEKINNTKKSGGKVIAVGTTSVRALESAALNKGNVEPFIGETDIFISPGFEFKVVDAIITNFHLPKSTLLMLVSAFAGLENTKKAYLDAIEKSYRFYSYGDAMLIYN